MFHPHEESEHESVKPDERLGVTKLLVDNLIAAASAEALPNDLLDLALYESD